MTDPQSAPTPPRQPKPAPKPATWRSLVHADRSDDQDQALALILAAVAGAANAGGFFAVSQYTSHMTGYLSLLADHLAVGNVWLAFISALVISAFVTGAGFSSVMISWAREHHSHHQYALPIAAQGTFLVCFAWGGIFTSGAGQLFSLACLSFIMGMQNATITKLSDARIRTTHVTGMVTDIGVEFGRAFYRLLRPRSAVRADRRKLAVLLWQVGAFLAGGVVGALGFTAVGFLFALPLGAILLGISVPHLLFDRLDPADP